MHFLKILVFSIACIVVMPSAQAAPRCIELLIRQSPSPWARIESAAMRDSQVLAAAIQKTKHIAFHVRLRHGGNYAQALSDLEQLIRARGSAAVWTIKEDVGSFVIIDAVDLETHLVTTHDARKMPASDFAKILHPDYLEVIQIGPKVDLGSKLGAKLKVSLNNLKRRVFDRPVAFVAKAIKIHDLNMKGHEFERKLIATNHRIGMLNYVESLNYPEQRYEQDVIEQNAINEELVNNNGSSARLDGLHLVNAVFRGDVNIDGEDATLQDLFKLSYLYRIFEWRRLSSMHLANTLSLMSVKANLRRVRLELAIADQLEDIQKIDSNEISDEGQRRIDKRESLNHELVALTAKRDMLEVGSKSLAVELDQERARLEKISSFSSLASKILMHFQNPNFYIDEKVAKKLGDLDRDYRREIEDLKVFSRTVGL